MTMMFPPRVCGLGCLLRSSEDGVRFMPCHSFISLSALASVMAGAKRSTANFSDVKSSTFMAYCPKYAPVWRAVAASAVTTRMGHGGRYLDIALAAAPFPEMTTMSSAAQSTAPIAADAAADSMVVNGLCVKSRRNEIDAEEVLASSALALIAAIVDTATAGNAPFAVSPDSIVASAPSNTAFATSSISARVGSGLSHIDSNICVAQMANRPATFAFVMSIFCASATFCDGISMPRSPRATMMPSEYLRIASMLATPSSFSILEMIWISSPPFSLRIWRTFCTSSPV
mmetsp:Transcript_8449/g.35345  ORF Transcript_8449/g.35345 Transcript_8449/m.35345 type:complete len:287 (-) Transcript_8449:1421-2281(-)